jgi:hypothetical protein
MVLRNFFKASAVTTALVLAGCGGGDININEGDVIDNSVTDNSVTNPPPDTPPDDEPPAPTSSAITPITQGLAVDVSSEFPEITDVPVFRINADTTFVEDTTLTSDVMWVLDGRIAVGGDNTNSAVLTVEPGTTIFGEEGDDFLAVSRGSQIEAVGTVQEPIVFTSVQDVTGQETGIGQWGGLVLLGRAPANSCGDQVGETTADELTNCGVSAEGDAGQFGGTDPLDSSGSLVYVRVQHAGRTLGNGDELNGISFAGVGSGTFVDFIQVHQNLDDGIEFFGGTVNVSHVVLTDIGDDSFDWSFGWTGNAQFVYIQQGEENGDNAFEADNSEFDSLATPLTNPTVANVTVVGADGANGIRLRAGTAGTLTNVLVTGPTGYDNCLRIDDEDAANNAVNGLLSITNSVIACADPTENFDDQVIGNGTTADFFASQEGNMELTPAELGLSSNGFIPLLSSPLVNSGSNARELGLFFDPTDYIGAFDGVEDWTADWTIALNGGFPTDIQNAFEQGLAQDVSSEFPQITDLPVYRLDADITFTQDVTLTNDALWVLDGRTAVGNDNEDSAVLFIEAGTTIFGEEGNDFLVVSRGSQIEALGSATSPIVMTSVQDVTGQETGIGQWGGLVLLGRAPANSCGDQVGETTPTELENCGVSAEGDAGQFGGTDPEDDSGTLNFVRVQFAGLTLGNGDELNGISFAGVGSGTFVDFIQVHQNLDDGIEFFGGTVNVSHVVLTEIGDDSFDWSFGWTGNAQFVLILQGDDDGDNAFESDNSEFDSLATPLTNPNVSNVTIVGSNGTNGVRLRAGTAGTLRNFVISGPEGYDNCLRIDDPVSQANVNDGSLSISSSVLACSSEANFDSSFEDNVFNADPTNTVSTPGALGFAANGFQPTAASFLLGSGEDVAGLNDFFASVDYIGAMDSEDNWTEGWTIAVNDGIPTDVQNAFEQGLAVDVSSEFPEITNLPVYRLNEDVTFTSDVTLTNDAVWALSGRVAVGNDNVDSATLFIQEGTTIFGEQGNDFLVVSRGSQIQALGSVNAPITMTSVQDVTGQETGIGQWGGLVLLGRAPANSCGDQVGETTPTELENCGVSAEGDAGQFGGTDPEDNSGILNYLIVQFAGLTLGNGDELNGISFAGVGSGTFVDFIQVHQNLDDGIEFFGGTVNVSHVVLTEIGDDSFDWSFGWTGNAQFVLINQGEDDGDNAFESDNSEFDSLATPLTNPNVANVTILGSNGTNGIRLRAGTAGTLRNFVVSGPAGYDNCLRIDDPVSQANVADGSLSVGSSVIACDPAENFDSQFEEDTFTADATNSVLTPADLGFAVNGYQPAAGSVLLGAGEDVSALDPFFAPVDYIGAMDENVDWTQGWVTIGLDNN